MKYDLKKPCSNCPFLRSTHFRFSTSRMVEIVEAETFPCHKTLDYTKEGPVRVREQSRHCAGHLILREKMEMPTQLMRIAERIGMYDRTKLEMDSDVYDTLDEMIEDMCDD